MGVRTGSEWEYVQAVSESMYIHVHCRHGKDINNFTTTPIYSTNPGIFAVNSTYKYAQSSAFTRERVHDRGREC